MASKRIFIKIYSTLLAAMYLSIHVAAIFCFISCNSSTVSNKEKNKDVLAKVYDRELVKTEIEGIVPHGTSKHDSILLIKNFIDSWIKKQVVLHKAEANIGTNEAAIINSMQEYRNSLIVFKYEQELIKQKLDTVVTEDEITKYYNSNPDNFELKENIVRFIAVKTNKNAPKSSKVKSWMESNNPRDRALLEDFCYQFATDYFLNDDQWVTFDKMVSATQIKTYNQEEFLRENRFVELPDSTNITFVRFLEFKIKNSFSPLAFEHANIKALIINKRKLELIKEMEKAAYNTAIQNNDIKIFNK